MVANLGANLGEERRASLSITRAVQGDGQKGSDLRRRPERPRQSQVMDRERRIAKFEGGGGTPLKRIDMVRLPSQHVLERGQ